MSATDSPRANSARVYEYIVAGETPGVPFTPADLAMASYITEHHPNTAQSMALNHLFIQVTARAFQEAGIWHYIDIGAGLPTEGALHEQIEAGAPVLYVDHDPEAVAFGQQLLADQSQLRYIQARLEDIGQILDQTDDLFDGQRLIGVNLISIVHFVSDDALQQSLRQLYNWAAPGSMLAITSTRGENNAEFQDTKEAYKQRTGLSVNLRTGEEVAALIAPWQVVTIAPLEAHVEAMLGTQVAKAEHRGWLGWGGIFVKP